MRYPGRYLARQENLGLVIQLDYTPRLKDPRYGRCDGCNPDEEISKARKSRMVPKSNERKARLQPVYISSRLRRLHFVQYFPDIVNIPLLLNIIMATCYIAAGIDMPEFGLCNTTASVSLCCFPGQICLSNGFCSTQSGQIYSGACTDPTYSSSICPEFCTFGICLP